MFLPIRTDSRLRTTPYMNWALLVANVLIWVGQNVFAGRPGEGRWYDDYMLFAAGPELHAFLTYGFLHSGAMHLIGNMLFLYIFGNNVNDKMGHVGYLAFYLSSIVASGLAWMAFEREGVVLGASGGVSAVVGAYLILFPPANVTVLVLFFIIGLYEIPSVWFILAFFAKDLIGLSGTTNVAHTAHIGGTLFGVAVCTALLTINLLPRDQFDVIAMVRQWNRRRQYRDAVSGGWNPYGAAGPARPARERGWVQEAPAPEAPPDPRQQQAFALRSRISEAIASHDLPAAATLYTELKTLDPQQVLARQQQLDVANQFASEQRYPQAAEAYETFLRHYPKYEQADQLELMLGLILTRFLNQPAKAREFLLRAQAKLMDENARRMARAELDKIEGAGGNNPSVPGTPNVGGVV